VYLVTTIENGPAIYETLVIEVENSFKTLSSLPLLTKLRLHIAEKQYSLLRLKNELRWLRAWKTAQFIFIFVGFRWQRAPSLKIFWAPRQHHTNTFDWKCKSVGVAHPFGAGLNWKQSVQSAKAQHWVYLTPWFSVHDGNFRTFRSGSAQEDLSNFVEMFAIWRHSEVPTILLIFFSNFYLKNMQVTYCLCNVLYWENVCSCIRWN